MLEYYVSFATAMMFVHWVADFVCQSDEMVKGKSSSIAALSKHILSYAVVFTVGTFITALALDGKGHSEQLFKEGFATFWAFVFINVGSHFFIDFITSRASKLEFERGNTGTAFKIIGFDQFLHIAIMAVSLYYMVT